MEIDTEAFEVNGEGLFYGEKGPAEHQRRPETNWPPGAS